MSRSCHLEVKVKIEKKNLYAFNTISRIFVQIDISWFIKELKVIN